MIHGQAMATAIDLGTIVAGIIDGVLELLTILTLLIGIVAGILTMDGMILSSIAHSIILITAIIHDQTNQATLLREIT